MTRRRLRQGAPADDLAVRIEALERAVASMADILGQVATLSGMAAEHTGQVVDRLVEQHLIQSALVERLAAEAGLIDQPTNTHH